MSPTLHPATAIGAVHLTVRDLERTAQFYRERLGFELRSAGGGLARLGAGGSDLLVLRESRDAPRPRSATGLYHFAVLVPTRGDLARALAHLLATDTRLSGASDHLVSEALYLSDPEGNGIEIYRDRPRSAWKLEQGEVRMDTLALDIDGLLEERGGGQGPWQGLPPRTRIGHVHLHVGHLDAAERFYVGVLGFQAMAHFGAQALMVAAGGYHHHIGLNVWKGVGAPPPPPGAAGLDHFEVRVPDAAEVEQVAERARWAGITVERRDDAAAMADPSRNRLVFTAAPGP
jgi:catechol 2,3-dioxygenase